MMNDTLASALSNINNAEKVGKNQCTVKPVSKVLKKVLDLMKDHRYIGSYEVIDDNKGGIVKINLIGAVNNCKAIKPRFSVQTKTYEKFEKRFLPAKDFGILIVSTSKGIMTHNESKDKKIGGKLLAYIY
ncbi:MAG: 30S ribosomal protein S8 [archaeon]